MYESNSDPLSQVRDEIVELEQRLEALESTVTWLSAAGRPATASFAIEESEVRRIITARRIRDRHLGADLVSDPAWDLLLEAFAAELGGHPITVAQCCRATNVPGSTALRWIDKLEKDGWIRLHGEDGQLLEITPSGSSRLRSLFQALGTSLLLT